MKRSGYTLAEVLIALAIVGIIAAVVAPMVNKFRPDTTKMAYLNTYDTLAKTINSIANNREFYSLTKETQATQAGFSLADAPLYNTDAYSATGADGKQYSLSGNSKFCGLLGSTYVPLDSSLMTACGNQSVYNEANFGKTFTDAKGTQYSVYSNIVMGSATIPSEYEAEITFDVNGDTKPNCMYNSSKCKKPDRFKVLVAPSGYIVASDEMGQAYLNSRTNTRRGSVDLENLKPISLSNLSETLIGTTVGIKNPDDNGLGDGTDTSDKDTTGNEGTTNNGDTTENDGSENNGTGNEGTTEEGSTGDTGNGGKITFPEGWTPTVTSKPGTTTTTTTGTGATGGSGCTGDDETCDIVINKDILRDEFGDRYGQQEYLNTQVGRVHSTADEFQLAK